MQIKYTFNQTVSLYIGHVGDSAEIHGYQNNNKTVPLYLGKVNESAEIHG